MHAETYAWVIMRNSATYSRCVLKFVSYMINSLWKVEPEPVVNTATMGLNKASQEEMNTFHFGLPNSKALRARLPWLRKRMTWAWKRGVWWHQLRQGTPGFWLRSLWASGSLSQRRHVTPPYHMKEPITHPAYVCCCLVPAYCQSPLPRLHRIGPCLHLPTPWKWPYNCKTRSCEKIRGIRLAWVCGCVWRAELLRVSVTSGRGEERSRFRGWLDSKARYLRVPFSYSINPCV